MIPDLEDDTARPASSFRSRPGSRAGRSRNRRRGGRFRGSPRGDFLLSKAEPRTEEIYSDSHRRRPAQPRDRRADALRQAAADTNGEYVVVDVVVEPNGSVAAAHLHPYQTETFEVLEGEVTFKVGRKKVVAQAGETVVVEPGTAHKFWNSGDYRGSLPLRDPPRAQFEQLIETMFSLAQDGKTNKKGMPNPLRLAVIAKAHCTTCGSRSRPPGLQKLGLMLGAPLGRPLGYELDHVSTGRTASRAAETLVELPTGA